MYTNVDGHGLSGFGHIATFQNSQISLLDHNIIVHGHQKLNHLELAQKFTHVEIDVTRMYTDFGGHDLSGFGDTATLKNGQISLSDHGLYPWSSKNLIDWN